MRSSDFRLVYSEFFAWDGVVGRREGLILVLLYVAYVGTIWYLEKRPPALGEVGEMSIASSYPHWRMFEHAYMQLRS